MQSQMMLSENVIPSCCKRESTTSHNGGCMKINISADQKDALKEVVTIGAGNAATALSQLVKKKVNITVPDVNLMPLDEVHSVFGSPESLVTSVYLQLLGDITGVILLSFEEDSATMLANLLLGKSDDDKSFDEMGKSSLKETTTIIAGAYLSAMSKFLKLSFLISNPSFVRDMAGAIVNNVLTETNKEADVAIIMQTEFEIADCKMTAYFFFVPESNSLNKLFKTMGL